MVLQWTYLLSCRNTFVGGTCAPPSALLVFLFIRFKAAGVVQCHATSTVSTHFLIHSSAHLCHQHSHHPSFLHSFTPGSKPTFQQIFLILILLLLLDCLHGRTGLIMLLDLFLVCFSVCPVWWTKLATRQLFTAR